MTEQNECPLVTFALFAYNQEKYIREAMEGAFSQDYPNLEIIISDDCSSDKTFELIQTFVMNHAGNRNVHLNRNECNVGIGAHVARIHAMARGDLIVHAAGDDISLHDRVSKLVKGYISSSQRPSLIESDAFLIDEDGLIIGRYHLPRKGGLYKYDNPWVKPTAGGGATYAIAKSLLMAFPPIPDDFIAEDALLALRANLLSGVLYISEPLVKYRVTSAGAWNHMTAKYLHSRQVLDNEIKWSKHRVGIADQALIDIAGLDFKKFSSFKSNVLLENDIRNARVELNEWLNLLEGTFLRGIQSLLWASYSRKHIDIMRWIKMFIIRWRATISCKFKDNKK